MRVGHADVEIRAPIAAADRAVVLRAGGRHRKAGPLSARFTAFRLLRVVTEEPRIATCPCRSAAGSPRSIGVTRIFAVLCAAAQETDTEDPHGKACHVFVGIPEPRARQGPLRRAEGLYELRHDLTRRARQKCAATRSSYECAEGIRLRVDDNHRNSPLRGNGADVHR